MLPGTASEQDPEDPEADFVEVDPTGRYVRYKEVLGRGAFKKVYRAFDELEGIEVAWNQVKVSELLRNSEDLERLYSEVHLLKTLKHKNIIKFYNSWVDTKNEHINFITEIFTSGTLRQYRKKHKHVDLRALKKWSRQILEGLFYLHSHDPPIIHRDLKCDNIFVNGNHGEVKIGDLGLAAILHHANAAHSVIGTPEFMAPELYEEEYNELVDIYAFGMCLLELVTFEYPYVECSNAAQIYKKVTSGIRPASLAKVADPDVKIFIEKCIANVSARLSAEELLKDPFLSNADNESISRPLRINMTEITQSKSDVGRKNSADSHPCASSPLHIKAEHSEVTNVKFDIARESSADVSGPSRGLTVQGERKDVNTIFIKLRIADSTGHFRNFHFPFDIEADTSIAVASEMVHELDLTDQDVPTIAELIDTEIRSHIPDWSMRESSESDFVVDDDGLDNKEVTSSVNMSENKDDTSSPMTNASGSLRMEQLPSGRKVWSDLPKAGGGFSPLSSPRGSSGVSPFNYSPLSQSDLISGGVEDGTPQRQHLPGTLEPVREDEEVADEHEQEARDDFSKSRVEQSNCDSGFREEYIEERKDVSIDELEVKSGLFDDSEAEKRARIVAEKLDLLLAEQQKELDEVKWRHELAVSDILKQFQPEMRLKVFNMCERKIPDYKLHCEMDFRSVNATCRGTPGALNNRLYGCSDKAADKIFTRSSSSIDVSVTPRSFHVLTRVGKLGGVDGPSLRDRSNSFKRETIPDMGIAVILKDDSGELEQR